MRANVERARSVKVHRNHPTTPVVPPHRKGGYILRCERSELFQQSFISVAPNLGSPIYFPPNVLVFLRIGASKSTHRRSPPQHSTPCGFHLQLYPSSRRHPWERL
jgi:hypothetical protein